MTRKQRLELTWIGKENRAKLEPRILLENPSISYHSEHRVTDKDIFDNMLIYGDNLLALKALESEYTGEVKCVFIDPPYNTGNAFEHYDDGIEHSLWLTLMRDRIELLRKLLSEDGSLWITIDDNEAHYLKVICDEIFGRDNFIGNAIWEKSDSPRMDAVFFSYRHDHLIVYAKDRNHTVFNRLKTELPEHYNKIDDQGRRYYLKPLRAMGGQGDSRAARPTLYYSLESPDGTPVYPKRQDGSDGAWRWRQEKVFEEKDRIEWVNGRNGWVPYYRIYGDASNGRPAETIWPHSVVGSNRTSKAEIKALFPDETPFGTPKPEALLAQIIHISTYEGDLVLDSFAGSGTTGAVAHKMGRRWIMVELEETCHTHIIPRLKKVIDGEDPGGITNTVNWQGGGGFRYYSLAPTLIVEDEWGNPVINKDYNSAMLAEAMCKLHGFTYAPNEEFYWMQGYSTETDFVYVTTQFMSAAMLEKISEEVGQNRSLLICCNAYKVNADRFDNLTLKKIPKSVLNKCEWGHDDYSLEIKNLPQAPKKPIDEQEKPQKRTKEQRRQEATLFEV